MNKIDLVNKFSELEIESIISPFLSIFSLFFFFSTFLKVAGFPSKLFHWRVSLTRLSIVDISGWYYSTFQIVFRFFKICPMMNFSFLSISLIINTLPWTAKSSLQEFCQNVTAFPTYLLNFYFHHQLDFHHLLWNRTEST